MAPNEAITSNASSTACFFNAMLYKVCTACSARSSAIAPAVSSSAVVNLGAAPPRSGNDAATIGRIHGWCR